MFDAKKYWNERLTNNYDLQGVGDISMTRNYNKWSYAVTRKILKRLFKKHAIGKTNMNVLDIGSGTGFVIKIWKDVGMKITGVDISPTAVKNLKETFPDESFIEFDAGIGSIPFADNYFNCCSAASVLYHIVDDELLENAISNIHRVLERDGIFIFSDNFLHQNNMSILHQKCRTLNEYEDILKRNGFDIVDRVPNYVLFNDPVDARSKFFPRMWYWNTRLSKKSRFYDYLVWPLLYPFELLLTSVMKESPAQEFMICKAIK